MMAIRTKTPGQQQQQTQMVPQIQQAAADPEVVDIALYCEPTEENISSDDDTILKKNALFMEICDPSRPSDSVRVQLIMILMIHGCTKTAWKNFLTVLDQTCTNQT